MALDKILGVFLAPAGQYYTNPSSTHNWNNLWIVETKGPIESPLTCVNRSRQSAILDREYILIGVLNSHPNKATKPGHFIFPALRYNASCCKGWGGGKITDFFALEGMKYFKSVLPVGEETGGQHE